MVLLITEVPLITDQANEAHSAFPPMCCLGSFCSAHPLCYFARLSLSTCEPIHDVATKQSNALKIAREIATSATLVRC